MLPLQSAASRRLRHCDMGNQSIMEHQRRPRYLVGAVRPGNGQSPGNRAGRGIAHDRGEFSVTTPKDPRDHGCPAHASLHTGAVGALPAVAAPGFSGITLTAATIEAPERTAAAGNGGAVCSPPDGEAAEAK